VNFDSLLAIADQAGVGYNGLNKEELLSKLLFEGQPV